jgi:hypothetical protein
MSDESLEYFRIWMDINPVRAFTSGWGGQSAAGKLPDNSYYGLQMTLEQIDRLQQRTANPNLKKYLQGIVATLTYQEPFMPVNDVTNAIFSYILVQASDQSICLLMDNAVTYLHNAWYRMQIKKWTLPILILTQLAIKGLIEILDNSKLTPNVFVCNKHELLSMIHLYSSLFQIPTLQNQQIVVNDSYENMIGLFEEFKCQRDFISMGRASWYSRYLTLVYDYDESPSELLTNAFGWIHEELSYIQKSIQLLQAKYDPDSVGKQVLSLEQVTDLMTKHNFVGLNDLVEITKTFQEQGNPNSLIKFFDQEIVTIPKQWLEVAKVVETPSYLTMGIPCAAANSFKEKTKHPIYLYFVTTDPKCNPMDNFVDLINTYVHEQFGHTLHMYNVYNSGAAPQMDTLDNTFSGAISEGIAFQRENEFQMRMDRTDKKQLPEMLKERQEELRFVMRKQRLIRFARVVCDIFVNLDVMTVPEVCKWIEKTVGIDARTMFYNFYTCHEAVSAGYATTYAVIGNKIRNIQKDLVDNPEKLKQFNNEAMNMGYQPTSRFIGRLFHKSQELLKQ